MTGNARYIPTEFPAIIHLNIEGMNMVRVAFKKNGAGPETIRNTYVKCSKKSYLYILRKNTNSDEVNNKKVVL